MCLIHCLEWIFVIDFRLQVFVPKSKPTLPGSYIKKSVCKVKIVEAKPEDYLVLQGWKSLANMIQFESVYFALNLALYLSQWIWSFTIDL